MDEDSIEAQNRHIKGSKITSSGFPQTVMSKKHNYTTVVNTSLYTLTNSVLSFLLFFLTAASLFLPPDSSPSLYSNRKFYSIKILFFIAYLVSDTRMFLVYIWGWKYSASF